MVFVLREPQHERKNPVISTVPPFILRFSKGERRVF